jgi:hypothetical protein
VLILCVSLVPASVVVSWGPGNDKVQAGALIDQASLAVTPDLLYADARYDAEWVHERCVDWGVMSGMKRTMGSTLNATCDRGLTTDAMMKVPAYAIGR